MRYIPRVLPYLRPYWRLATASVVLLVLASLFSLLTPWPLTILVDNVLGNEPLIPLLSVALGSADKTTLLIVVVIGGLLITFVSGGLDVLSNYVNTKLEQKIVLDFRSDLFRHAQSLSVAYADQVSTGRLMYGINFEAAAAGSVIMAIEPLAKGLLTIVGMVWISFHIDPMLALLALTVVPFLYYSVGYYAKHIQTRLMAVKGMEADSLSIVHDALSMLRVIVAFVREAHEVTRFRNQGERTVDARVKLTVRQTIFSLAVSMITAMGTALVLGVGAYHAMQGQLTAGQLLVVLSYVASVYKPLEAISHTVGALQDSFVGLQMAFHVLDTKPLVHDGPQSRRLDQVRGRVTFEGVCFSYPGRVDTLKDVSFDAAPGQVVAIVGATGAGKTTLISLLPRFYDPTAGRVLLDGIDIRELSLESLRSHISLVPQEPILFAGTIADNIRYGRLDASKEEIVRSARSANAHDFIMALPMQYDTLVGERGVQLSGGERQRICVARAFLKDAPILILDEPTSSIDSRTEAVILDALDELMVGRTTFMIAHRLSTVRHADLILVLDHGQLREHGTADELLQKNGLYRQLHDVQMAPRHRRARPASPQTEPWVIAAPSAQRRKYGVDWISHGIPQRARVREEIPVQLHLRNAGTMTWPSATGARANDSGVALGGGPAEAASAEAVVAVAYHWLGESDEDVVEWEGCRTPLPHDVRPGEQLILPAATVIAPDRAGDFRLQMTLVHESVTWFEHQGASTITVPVRVECEAKDVDASDSTDSLAAAGLFHGWRA